MKKTSFVFALVGCLGMSSFLVAQDAPTKVESIVPKDKIELFNRKDLTGWYTWLRESKYDDPKSVFTVGEDGILRISGDGFGGIVTKDEYKDYYLVMEYRWGTKTWAPRADRAKDGGILVHCVGPDGGFGGSASTPGPWMSSIEFQIIEGGVGDILVLSGLGSDGKNIPVTATVESKKDRDGEPVFSPGDEKIVYSKGRINWWGRDPDWKDVLGFRGPSDPDSVAQEWTTLECYSKGDTLVYVVNGVIVNKATGVNPAQGKILVQTEGAEMFVRKIELLPLPDSIPE